MTKPLDIKIEKTEEVTPVEERRRHMTDRNGNTLGGRGYGIMNNITTNAKKPAAKYTEENGELDHKVMSPTNKTKLQTSVKKIGFPRNKPSVI